MDIMKNNGKRDDPVLGDGKARMIVVSIAHNMNLMEMRVNAPSPCWGMGKRLRLLEALLPI